VACLCVPVEAEVMCGLSRRTSGNLASLESPMAVAPHKPESLTLSWTVVAVIVVWATSSIVILLAVRSPPP
jgi:hypothetical protein